jgi:uncharacterized protein Smg (DUF494 family)
MIEKLEPRDIVIDPQSDSDIYNLEACGKELMEIAKRIKLMRKLILTEPARFEQFPDPDVRKYRMDEEARQLHNELVGALNFLAVRTYSVFSETIKIDTWKYLWDLQAQRDEMSVDDARKLMR